MGAETDTSASRGIALVLLAAGESSRLGVCKALVPITPRTPLDLLLDAGAVLGGPPPLVIAGVDHAAIAAAAGARAEVALNPDWRAGRSGGVLLAARLRPGHDLCIAPVDTPLVPSEVFAALAETWRLSGAPPGGWAAPWVPGGAESRTFGHPVILGRDLALRISGIGHEASLRALRALATPLLAVEVASRTILDDLDLPEDLRRLRTRPDA